jgi:gluconate 2-dehydrogenase gamma chain
MAVTAVAGTGLASGCLSHRSSRWDSLNDREARTLTVLCDQIIPADDFPSASQAGVLTFIDIQLARSYRRFRDAYRNGLRQANQLSQSSYGVDLTMASPQQQLALVSALEQHDGEFFELVRSHTLQGYYGSPRHGGNRDAVSWRMLGLVEPPLRGRAQYDFTRGARP